MDAVKRFSKSKSGKYFIDLKNRIQFAIQQVIFDIKKQKMAC